MQVEYSPLYLPLNQVVIRQYNWNSINAISFIPFPPTSSPPIKECVAIWKVKRLNPPQ